MPAPTPAAALAATTIAGIETNLDYLRAVCDDEVFANGGFHTSP